MVVVVMMIVTDGGGCDDDSGFVAPQGNSRLILLSGNISQIMISMS